MDGAGGSGSNQRLVPDRRCLKRADTAPTLVASGRTGVRAKAAVQIASAVFPVLGYWL
jgi:hypothetical protein